MGEIGEHYRDYRAHKKQQRDRRLKQQAEKEVRELNRQNIIPFNSQQQPEPEPEPEHPTHPLLGLDAGRGYNPLRKKPFCVHRLPSHTM